MDKMRDRTRLGRMLTRDFNPPYLSLGMRDEAFSFPKETIGNYALGEIDNAGDFIVGYVGRSDTNLRERLMTHHEDRYSHFKFSYAKSPQEAFEKECRNFHDFGGAEVLDNDIHPAVPAGTKLSCPVPGCEHPNG